MSVIITKFSKDENIEMGDVIRYMNKEMNTNIKSVEGLIEKIEDITPKATVRYGKLSIDSCLMIPINKVIETIIEYCEVDKE